MTSNAGKRADFVQWTSKESTDLMKGHIFHIGDRRINLHHDWNWALIFPAEYYLVRLGRDRMNQIQCLWGKFNEVTLQKFLFGLLLGFFLLLLLLSCFVLFWVFFFVSFLWRKLQMYKQLLFLTWKSQKLKFS